MDKIANIIAILYVLGGILVSIGMFLIDIPNGFVTLGVLFFIPTVILYLEGSKAGGK